MLVGVSMAMRRVVFVLHSRTIHFFVDQNVCFGSRDAAAIHFADRQSSTDIQRSNRILEDRSWNSGIDHGAEEHVAADAGETIYVGDLHGSQRGERSKPPELSMIGKCERSVKRPAKNRLI